MSRHRINSAHVRPLTRPPLPPTHITKACFVPLRFLNPCNTRAHALARARARTRAFARATRRFSISAYSHLMTMSLWSRRPNGRPTILSPNCPFPPLGLRARPRSHFFIMPTSDDNVNKSPFYAHFLHYCPLYTQEERRERERKRI